MECFRVIIAGGRDFADYGMLEYYMDRILSSITQPIVVVCGKARGADTLGERYGKEHGYEVSYYPAEWDKYGKQAGFIRNEVMARNADALVAFWDGSSHGTQNMIELAKRYRLKFRVINY